MEACSRCEKVRELVHASGLCRPCYVRKHARDVTCAGCGEVRQVQGHGLCRRCYLAQPHVREAKNRARREKYAADPAHRKEVLGVKAAQGSSECARARQRARNRRHFYRLTEERFQALWEHQRGVCAICLRPLEEGKKTGVHVDHCHSTGAVRGLLCGPCNSGIGHLGDSAVRVAAALEYLRLPPATLVE
jgi:hypothetical protein